LIAAETQYCEAKELKERQKRKCRSLTKVLGAVHTYAARCCDALVKHKNRFFQRSNSSAVYPSYYKFAKEFSSNFFLNRFRFDRIVVMSSGVLLKMEVDIRKGAWRRA